MIAATRRWIRRNRTPILVTAAVVGTGVLVGQYVLGKIHEARQRMSEDRINKENLRRRFEQNQEDCTYTVLALLPTIREEIVGALPVEQITEQLQQERQERLRRLGQSEAASSELPSGPPASPTMLQVSRAAAMCTPARWSVARPTGASLSGRPKRSKAQLWQEMKIHSITRALTLLYTVSLLTMLTRIQLNLLGRRTYLSSVVALASPPASMEDSAISMENRDDDNYENMYGNDFDTNRKYLTFSWWLLHRGSKQIMQRVMDVVKDVFGPVNIREDIGLDRLSDLLMQVRRRVEGAKEEERRQMKWLSYLLPPKEEEAFVIRQSTMSDSEDFASPRAAPEEDPMNASAVEDSDISDSLRRLLDETSDLIDSPTFVHVLTRLLDTEYSHLVDYRIATEAYEVTGPTAPGVEPRIQEVVDKKCKLAHLLPIFCKQAHVITAGSGEFDTIPEPETQQTLGNEYVAAMERVSELGAFAAVIYSSNFDYEMAENATANAPLTEQTEHPSASEVLSDALAEDSTGLTAQVGEKDPQGVGENAAGVGGFESAWKKALADEESKGVNVSD